MFRFLLALVIGFVMLASSRASAGDGYIVTAVKPDGTQISYEVQFGDTMQGRQRTGFDPVSNKFVYLSWKPEIEEAPKPVCVVFDSETGRKIPLYKFPGVEHPLPIIATIDALKVCPFTGDKNLKIKKAYITD